MILRELAEKFLPPYGADTGALTKAQLTQIKTTAPQSKESAVRSNLFRTAGNLMQMYTEPTAGGIVPSQVLEHESPEPNEQDRCC